MIMSETLKSNPALEDGYRAMANDEDREAVALEWAEATIGDVADELESGLAGSFRSLSGPGDQKTRPAFILSNSRSNKAA